MEKNKKTLVIIPARGGSKRIPHKNIREICGQPMIYWPLMELSKLFKSKNVIVTTDDDEIVSKVEKVGLRVPFKRPEELSDDHTGTMPVATHALQWFESNVARVEYVIIVYPTAVMLNVEDICSALSVLNSDPNCDSVMSATHFPFPIQRAVYKNSEGYAEMFKPEHYSTKSQDLTEGLHDAGQFYVCRAESVRVGKTLTNSKVKLHPLHKNKVVDIDTIEDFEVAEARLQLFEYGLYDKDWSFD